MAVVPRELAQAVAYGPYSPSPFHCFLVFVSRFLFFLLALSLLCVGASRNAHADITYIYDELGRLVGAVDANGEAATYNYDATGNITSITRQGSSQVSIIEFTPNSGPVGTMVTIYGTGFSATASLNTVKFNGTTAAVSSATTTQIVATVPSGATTGPINIVEITCPWASAAGR